MNFNNLTQYLCYLCLVITTKQPTSLNNKIIKPAVDNSDNYYLTDTLVGFDYDSAFGTLIRKLLPGTGWTLSLIHI